MPSIGFVRTSTRAAAVLAVLACLCLPATAQNKTLLTVSRYDSQSLDAQAGNLANLRPFDITMVTPGTNATAIPWITGAGLSAVIGDADNDGTQAEFAGLPQAGFGLGDLFIKDADRKKGDPRLVYWTVRINTLPSQGQIDVFTASGKHTMRVGDWVRILPNGDAEFFITQELIMKAAGTQKAPWVPGADALCQASNGDLYYSPANGPIQDNSRIAGGHWTNNGNQWLNDGSIVCIPNSAITYDAKGNVADIVAGSALPVVGEVTNTSSPTPSVRTMCVNSGALDSIGKQTSITFSMTGLEIDPNGGTFPAQWGTTTHPNLIFTFNNSATTCCGGPWGSWMGTVFSTAKNTTNQNGSIATINGVTMGTTVGMADGSWTGIKAGTGSTSAPLLRALALIEAGFKSVAPYGSAHLGTVNDGLVDTSKDPNIRIGYQGPAPVVPGILLFGVGPGMGGRPLGFDLSVLFSGFADVHVLRLGPYAIPLAPTSSMGRAAVTLPVPNDPRLIGASLIWQGLAFTSNIMTAPLITEIR